MFSQFEFNDQFLTAWSRGWKQLTDIRWQCIMGKCTFYQNVESTQALARQLWPYQINGLMVMPLNSGGMKMKPASRCQHSSSGMLCQAKLPSPIMQPLIFTICNDLSPDAEYKEQAGLNITSAFVTQVEVVYSQRSSTTTATQLIPDYFNLANRFRQGKSELSLPLGSKL